MQLASKMRFISCQLNALFEDGAKVALENAKHANAMAAKLFEGITEIAKSHAVVSMANRAEANAVFPILPAHVTAKLQDSYRFYVWNQATGQVRLMCAFDTTQSDVEGLLSKLLELLEASL
jgi:threonine aldolase